MAERFIGLTVDRGAAVLRLDRSPVNAMDRAFVEELTRAVESLGEDSSVRVVIIASAVHGVYSAGADIKELSMMDQAECQAFIAWGQGLCNAIETLPKPVIAAVEGACVGGGLELAMACDLRVVGRAARFGSPEVDLGLLPGWGGTQRMPRLVGQTRGLELLMTGEYISAGEALALGLANRVVDEGRALDAAMELAERLLEKPAGALAVIKASVRKGMAVPLEEGLRMESDGYRSLFASEEAKKGIRAFLEKRRPRSGGG